MQIYESCEVQHSVRIEPQRASCDSSANQIDDPCRGGVLDFQ